jgi:formylglycine-generating enzyme required for sulfatase activity
MGVVLRGRAPDGSAVALKLLLGRFEKEALARFDRERRILAQLGSGEGFVPLLDAGDSPQGPFLVMPFLGGGTLRARLKAGALPIDEAVRIAVTLAEAMARAHARAIVHRDLKPENVLFDAAGNAFIADLGLAKHWRRDVAGASQSVALSKDGQVLGSQRYMSPEQALSSGEVGPATDVFALGAIIHECVTGEYAFDGETSAEIVARAASGSVTPLRELRPDAPRWLEHVVKRALAPLVKDRYSDAAALAAALVTRGKDTSSSASGTARLAARLAAGGAGAVALVLAAVAVALGGALLAIGALGRAHGGSSSGPATPAPAPATVTTAARTDGPPDWFTALDRSARPPYPLPRGVRFGSASGEYVNEKDGSVLVFVAGGTSLMGREKGDASESPVHEVRLGGFFVGKLEVSVGQFARFEEAAHYVAASERDGNGFLVGENGAGPTPSADATWRAPHGDKALAPLDHPVTQVNWADAAAYCEWAGLVLPTEAQWEKAAAWAPGAKVARRYAWGDEVLGPTSRKLANVLDEDGHARWKDQENWFVGYHDGFPGIAPVGSFPEGTSGYGALDMTGNVEEWCRDAYDPLYYASSPKDEPFRDVDEHTEIRCTRGESFYSGVGNSVVQHRGSALPQACFEDRGFRVALPLTRSR